jgi:hypothetical protein
LLPLIAKALIKKSAFGFHAVALPVAISNAAILFLVCPPMVVNVPPV